MAEKQKTARTDFFVPMANGQPVEMRLAWPHFPNKRTKDYDGKDLAPADQYYDCTLFIPKTATSPWECRNYMAIATPLLAIVKEQWPQGWPGQLVATGPCFWPITDCDLTTFLPVTPGTPMPRSVKADYLDTKPWAANHWMISVWSNQLPRAAGPDNNDLPVGLDGTLLGLKSGDYVFASINGWTYVAGTGGVSLGFEGVKKVRDGDTIGGGAARSAAQMFAGTPVAAAGYAPPPIGGYAAPAPVVAPPIPQGGYGAPQVAPAPAYAPQPVYAPAPAPAPAVAPVAYPAPGGYAAPAPAGQPVAQPNYPGLPPVSAPLYGTR